MLPKGDSTSRESRAEILFELSKSAYIDSGYFEIAAENVALAAAQGLGIARASVWLTSPDLATIRCAGLVEDGRILSVEGAALKRDDFPLYFGAMLADRVIAAEDVAEHPDMLELVEPYARPLGIVAMLDVPFRFEGRVAGLICCEHRERRSWPEAEQHFVVALTEIAGRALGAEARQRAEDALKVAKTGIEAQVAERTIALRAALGQLQQAQNQLIQVEKMAALGALVAGVAHEINTPLGVSVTAASHLKDAVCNLRSASDAGSLTRDAFVQFLDSTDDAASILLRNLERAADLVQSFKRVAVNQSDEAVDNYDLRRALQDLLHSLSPVCKRQGVACELHCPDDIVMRGYVGALDQVITNLIVNALRHGFEESSVPGEARIVVAASNVDQQARISVADNGRGIDPALLPRVFDPFVTTKRDQGGSGLGLHIVLNLVHYRMKGRVEVESTPDLGTTFIITVPQNPEESPSTQAHTSHEPASMYSAALAERGRRQANQKRTRAKKA